MIKSCPGDQNARIKTHLSGMESHHAQKAVVEDRQGASTFIAIIAGSAGKTQGGFTLEGRKRSERGGTRGRKRPGLTGFFFRRNKKR